MEDLKLQIKEKIRELHSYKNHDHYNFLEIEAILNRLMHECILEESKED